MSDRVPYTSNASLDDVARRLRSAKHVVTLTHSKPDGDAVGCSLAVARALHRLGVGATPVFLPPWPSRMNAVVGPTPIIHANPACWDKPPISVADAAAVLDTGSWTQISEAKAWLSPRASSAVVVDHHSHGDGDIAALRHVVPDSASCAELVADLCLILLGVGSYAKLPVEIAEPLYLGVATDTGWFRYSNMRPSTLRLAADLIDAGVDANRLYRAVEQADTPNRLELIRRALQSLEILDNGRAAMMTLTKADIEASGATQEEVSGLTDLPQTIGTVRVVAVLTELEGNLTKVSFRSKAADPGQREIDVNALAQRFSGGGHLHASGAKIRQPLAEVRPLVAAALVEALR